MLAAVLDGAMILPAPTTDWAALDGAGLMTTVDCVGRITMLLRDAFGTIAAFMRVLEPVTIERLATLPAC